jgi:hypothetical protein
VRSTRLVITGLAALAAAAISPGWAAAASPLVDDTVADFSAGTPGTGTWAVEPGSVQRRPAVLSENFDGTVLPSGLESTAWSLGGASAVAGGAVTVDGARLNTSGDPSLAAPQVLEFRGTFGGDDFEHAGFGTDFNDDGPWAMFSTGSDGDPATLFVYARSSNADPAPNTDLVPGVDATVPHTYRIEWTATDVKFSVDGGAPITITKAIAGPMRPVASDLTPAGGTIKIDWVGLGALPASGTFTSRVLDAGDTHAVWGALTSTGLGTSAIRTRTGDTATPDSSWSDFQVLGTGGAVQSAPGRYIQYEATLDDAASRLDSVSVAYTLDDAAPDAAIGGVSVSGTSATVSFTSPAADVARFECSLDGGAFAACTSPKQFSGLAAGAHSVAVRAVDRVGNTGNPASSSFRVESPPAQGGGGTPAPAPAPAADKTAPKVTLKLLAARVSKSGAVTLRAGCPSSETRCTIGVALKLGRSTVAKKTITVTGGKTAKVTLRLSKSARRKLAKSGRLSFKAVITATDAAHNTSTATVRLKLRAPSA